MEKIKVLVLGVGGNVSQGIIKALRHINSLSLEIIGACVSENSAGLYLCDKGFISPYANDENFINWLIDICNCESIDIVMSGVEENIQAILKDYIKFSEKTTAKFVSSSYENVLIGNNKFLTCDWLKKNNCNYPKYCLYSDKKEVTNLINLINFPLILKPINGKGSKNVFVIKSYDDFPKQINSKDYILQECVGNDDSEYTVGCYGDKKGKLVDLIIMKRKLLNGTTVWAKVVDDNAIKAETIKICDKFKPIGPLNIQYRKNEYNIPICFEMNVRFSGTTPMRSKFGFRDVEAMIREYVLNEDIKNCFKVEKGEVFRYTNEFYLKEETMETMGKNKKIESMENLFLGIDLLEKNI